jgi:YfiH family protein
VQARAIFTGRTSLGGSAADGGSVPPYDLANLAGHVGDDPAAVAVNRAQLAGALGLAVDRLVWMDQVHGASVAVVDDSSPARSSDPLGRTVPETDALVTTDPSTALAVLVADCVPVLLADESAGVLGAAHAGRRGLHNGVVPATIGRMVSLGARLDRLTVRLGPAVCGLCYEVPADLRDEVAAVAPAAAATTRHGTPALDIRAGLVEQLERLGVPAPIVSATCTVEDREFFSYRRDGVTGRFAGVIWFGSS